MTAFCLPQTLPEPASRIAAEPPPAGRKAGAGTPVFGFTRGPEKRRRGRPRKNTFTRHDPPAVPAYVPAGWDERHQPHRVNAIGPREASQEPRGPVWGGNSSDPASPTPGPPSASADGPVGRNAEPPVVAGLRYGLAHQIDEASQPPGGVDPEVLRQSAQPVHRPGRLDPFEDTRTLYYGRIPVGRLH